MEIEHIRIEIDTVDHEIITLLARRKTLIKMIGEIKKRNNLPVHDKLREEKLLKRLLELAEKQSLDKKYIERIYQIILKESKKTQTG